MCQSKWVFFTDPVCLIEGAVRDLGRDEVVQHGTERQAVGKTLAKVFNEDILRERRQLLECNSTGGGCELTS